MRYRDCCFLLFFVFIMGPFRAQTNDFGIWTTIGTEKKFGKWDFGATAELRTKDMSGTVDRWSFQLEATYKLFKPLKIGLSYQYIYFHDIEYLDFQPRQRYIGFVQGTQKFGNFSFSLRQRFQRTVKDERDRLTEIGSYDTYKINPEWTWRNRFKVSYNIPKFPVNPALSFESFYQLNNPDGNSFDKLRYTLSFDYKLTRHHQLEIYSLMDKEINVNNPVTKYIAGLGYTFSF